MTDYTVVACSNCRAEVEVEVVEPGPTLRQTVHARTGWPDADCDLTQEDIDQALTEWQAMTPRDTTP
jgi:hypothetical protein